MPPLTYSTYLKLDELLSIQSPRSDGPEHDEMLFIVVHQVYELWFKEIIHEVDYLGDRLVNNDTPHVQHTFKRVLTILKVLVAQLDVLETMTPLEFLSFRDRLESGSGFQSYQFRELEFLLGYQRRKTVDHFPEGSPGRERLESRYGQPTLWDHFLRYLKNNDYNVPDDQLNRDITAGVQPSPGLQKVLVDLYRNDPVARSVCERLVDFDEGFQEWRYRHVKMVQRTIGTKQGTGGSSGADYLKTTLFHPVFPDLWEIRSEF